MRFKAARLSLMILLILAVLTLVVDVVAYQAWWKPRCFTRQELERYRAAKALVNDSRALAYLDLFDEETWERVPTMGGADAKSLADACKAAQQAWHNDAFKYALDEQVWVETGTWRGVGYIIVPQKGDPRFEKIMVLAQEGDPFFMTLAGRLYELGVGTIKSQAKAVIWYRKAAERGDAGAAYFLGRLSMNGSGGVNTQGQESRGNDRYFEAGRWYEKAADLGNGYAAFCLGQMYINGQLGTNNVNEAVKWYLKGADLGTDVAEESLGDIYFNGHDVATNMVEAAKWYRLAADQGASWAQFRLGYMYADGLGVQQDYGEALQWYQKASLRGTSTIACVADRNLGFLYYNGQGVAQNFPQAFNYLSLSAKAGDSDSEYLLGLMYELGQGVETNRNKAVDWYRKAATQGNIRARSRLVNMLQPTPAS